MLKAETGSNPRLLVMPALMRQYKRVNKMKVQHIKYRTLHSGDQEDTFCESCSSALGEMIESNASTNSFGYLFEPRGDWHEGECKDHETTQLRLDKSFERH